MNAKINLYNKEDILKSNNEIVDKDFADLYLQSIHTTTKRCYWAYSALLLVCITALMAFYLEYFSYTEKYVKSANLELTDIIRSEYIDKFVKSGVYTKADSIYYSKGTDVTRALLDNQIRNFVDTQYISFPILGFKLSTSDTLFLISIFFIIVSLWSFYCVRGENFTVGKVLNETANSPLLCRKYIFQGICFNNMFFPTTLRVNPYSELKHQSNIENKIEDKHEKRVRKDNALVRFYRWAPKIIFYLPCIIIFSNCVLHVYDVVTLDCVSYNSTNEILTEENMGDIKERIDGNVLSLNRGIDTLHLNDNKVFRMNYVHQVSSLKKYGASHIMLGTVITLISFFIVFAIILKILSYISGTNSILYQYRRKVKHDEEISWINQKIGNPSYTVGKVFVSEYDREKFEKEIYNNSNLYYGMSASGDSLEKVLGEFERVLVNLPNNIANQLWEEIVRIKDDSDEKNKKFYEYYFFIEIKKNVQSVFTFG